MYMYNDGGRSFRTVAARVTCQAATAERNQKQEKIEFQAPASNHVPCFPVQNYKHHPAPNQPAHQTFILFSLPLPTATNDPT
jgi:hypothetical protein